MTLSWLAYTFVRQILMSSTTFIPFRGKARPRSPEAGLRLVPSRIPATSSYSISISFGLTSSAFGMLISSTPSLNEALILACSTFL